jgi:hypothetical protein
VERLLQLATMLCIAAFLFRQVYDADTFWHLAIGRDILANMAVPRSDHYALAALGRPYHDSHWLFQVLLATADRLLGMAGVSLAMAGIWAGTFALCYKACRSWLSVTASCLLVFLAAMVCSQRFSPRPDIVTCFMIAAFYYLIQERRYHSLRGLATLGILQLLWTNSHGLFVIGPFMAGCNLLVKLRHNGQAADKTERRASVRLFCTVMLTTLITPYGLDGWRYAALLFTEVGAGAPALFRTLEELAPTFGSNSLAYPNFWFYLLLLATFIGTTLPTLRQQGLSYGRMLIVAGLLFASLSGKRNMPLFALAAAPFIAENVSRLTRRRSWPVAVQAILATGLLAITWLPLSGRYYQMFGYPTRFGLGTSPTNFPPGLIEFIRHNDMKGHLYSGNYLGGFFLYHGIMPLVDGRWEVYDQRTLSRIIYAPLNDEDWNWLLQTYDIRSIALLHGAQETKAIIPRLIYDGSWQRVYEDSASSLWRRSPP